MKGATDTSNFDDYPDSDQEPPAVNALGRLEPFRKETPLGAEKGGGFPNKNGKC